MVATAAQIAANRANALRSTGPRTAEGKAASRRNALTHGAHATDDTILAAAPNAYLDGFHARFQPADALEAHLVEHLAILALRRDRLNDAMDALLELNERHALTEHLHERYGVNTPNAYIPGQPSWQAAMRRYDGNTYVDDRRPEPVSDPDLDPDPILCSLAYTLSSPRAAALFRHEASVDRRFTATLKQLTTLQAQRRTAAAAESTSLPTRPPHEPRLQRALDRYLRETGAAPAGASFAPAPPSTPSSISLGAPVAADPGPAPTLSSQSPAPTPDSMPATPIATAAATPSPDLQRAALAHAVILPLQHEPTSPELQNEATLQKVQNEANQRDDPFQDQPDTFLGILAREPHLRSSIPAFYRNALLPAGQEV
jgi:hypothetical protein